MSNKLDAYTINQEPIENILSVIEAKGDLKIQGNKISMDGTFSTKYRFDRQKNIVGAFNIEMPSGRPFNFIKKLYYSHLEENDAIKETYNWFKKYYGINDEYSGDLKMNDEYICEIKKRAEERKIKIEKEEKSADIRRRTFGSKFNKLKKIYSPGVLEYFENRGISKETLEKSNARIGIVYHNGKNYKNKVFFPMLHGDKVVGIKMRDIYAKQKEFKSMNMPDSGAGLLFDIKAIENQSTVYLCEGEIDKMSLDEAGITNNIGNLMGANTFSKNWIELFEKFENINILYDFDKDSLAGLKGVYKVMKMFPDKNIKFLDLPKLFDKYYTNDRDYLLGEYSDINDIWVTSNFTNKGKDFFKEQIDNSLEKKNIEELEIIIRNFKEMDDKEKEDDIGTFSLSFKSQLKSINDLLSIKKSSLS